MLKRLLGGALEKKNIHFCLVLRFLAVGGVNVLKIRRLFSGKARKLKITLVVARMPPNHRKFLWPPLKNKKFNYWKAKNEN